MEMKGFNLSDDYELLWNLIHDGYRIPAWILYTKTETIYPIYDLVEVKMAYKSDRYSIAVRGIGYDTFDKTLDAFKMNCKSLKLEFIMPNKLK